MPGGWSLGARRTVVLVAALSLAVMPFDAVRVARAARAPLPFTAFSDMHVDYQRRHVFVTGGSGTNSIFVFGFDGRQVARIDGLAGAADLLPDANLLYVALSNANEIAVVDMKTLKVTDRLDVSPYAQPVHLSKSRDTIYFTHSCTVYREGGFASVDLTSRVPIPHDDSRLTGCVAHAVVPHDPNTMFVWDPGGLGSLQRFNVTARRPVYLDSAPDDGYFVDVTFSSDGETFYALKTLSGSGIDQRRISDYGVVMNYPGGAAAYALTPDEGRLFSATDYYGAGLAVYRAGSPAPVSTMDLDGDPYGGAAVVHRALEAGPSGDRVFAVATRGYYYDSGLSFRVIWPQYRVAAGPGGQSVPAAGNGYDVWTSGGRRTKHETLVARKDGKTFRVNPLRTSGYAGGVDGRRLVYQVVRGRRSDLRLYDLKKRRQISTLDRMNTRGWEWHPTISGGRVLFTRNRGSTSQVILQSLKGGRARVLARERGDGALVAGQVNGAFATWTMCGATCDVYRKNLRTGGRTKVPRPARRINYGGSVTRDGTVYYMQSGFRCGSDAKLLRFAGGRVTEIEGLGAGRDGFFTYADDAADRVLFDRAVCTYRGTGSRWDVMSFRDVPIQRDAKGADAAPGDDEESLPPLEGEPWFDGLLPGAPR